MTTVVNIDADPVTLTGHGAARRFCRILAGDEPLTFEGYFPKRDPRCKNPALRSRRSTGTLDEVLPELKSWEAEGRSIYVRVNRGGTTRESVTGIRSVSVEFDAPEDHHAHHQTVPDDWHQEPTMIVRRGGSVHAHWCVGDCPVERHDELQQRAQLLYGSDPGALGRQRVWRLPGFSHPLFPEENVELVVGELAELVGDDHRYAVEGFERGLPELPADDATEEPSVARGTPIDESALRAALSHIDPTFAEEQPTWVGIAKAIRWGQLPVEDAEYMDWEDLLDDWCSGRLWQERIGDSSFEVPTYHGREELLRRTGDRPRTTGATVTLGTILKLAQKGGYRGRTVSPAETFGGLPVMTEDRDATGECLGRWGSTAATHDGWSDGTIGDAPEGLFLRNPKTGALLQNFRNALIAVHHMSATPQLDDFTGRVLFRGCVPWDPERYGRVLDDDLLRVIRANVIQTFGLELSRENLSEAVLTEAAKHRFHAVREYLDGLEWDGEERVDSWLVRYLGAPDTPYVRAAGRKWLLGAVARALCPGCKFDTMMVLEERQGSGKSTVPRVLAGDEWFSDSLPADLHRADAAQALQGKWIVELPELDGLSRSQVTTVKAFLSRQVDRARFAYDRYTRDYRRGCVFIGSANDAAYLRDPTGARRFWPVPAPDVDLDGLRGARDQIWAEATVLYLVGEDPVLPRELWADAAREQEERHAEDPWADRLRDYLDGRGEPGPAEPVDRAHSSHLLERVLGLTTGAQTTNHATRLKAIMTSRLGWTYRRNLKVGGVNKAGYLRPGADDEEGADG